jgi:hypothetical protein
VVVDDADLDSEYGDFVVKKSPPRWKGEDFAGMRLSQCTAEFLESLAGFNDWRGKQDDLKGEKTAKGQPKSFFAYKDAARCRGWAARLRNGHKPAAPADKPTQVPMGGCVVDAEFVDDEIPF